MVAALLAGGAGHVGDGAPGVDDQRELLRGRPDVQPRRVIPVGEEIVVEAHAGAGVTSFGEPSPGPGRRDPARVGVGEREREHQRRPRGGGPVGGSGSGDRGGSYGEEKEGQGKGWQRAERTTPAAARHGRAARGNGGGSRSNLHRT